MKKLLSLLMIMTFVVGTTYASFPVQNANKANTTVVDSKNANSTTLTADANEIEEALTLTSENGIAPKKLDEMVILLLLWFFLGGFAAHRWYAGKDLGWNILFIITGGGCGIWAIVDLVKIIQGKF
jgi:hypothetical protein